MPFARFKSRHASLKFPNFFYMYDQWQEMAGYDFYLWADDDIEISTSDVLAFMSRVEQDHLDLAQPALTSDSAISWPHLRCKPGKDVEQTCFVEIQFFAMSKRLFDLAVPFFRQGLSGFGMDVATARLCRRHRLRSAVIHSIRMRHPDRPKSETIHADDGLRAANDRIMAGIYRQLGATPTVEHLQYISAKVRTLTPAVLLLTSPVYLLRVLAVRVLQVLRLRKR
jgi:hypothetical protein